MPAKHSIKQYVPDSYYHLFNRGVEKRKIFQDKQDYAVFLSYLKIYLEPKNTTELRKKLARSDIGWKEKDKFLKLLRLNNFHQEIQLLSYCLMPNHFHLLVKQKGATTIDSFMRSFFTRYTIYFNKKNKRVGHLFQGRYKAVLINTEEQLLHLSRYIHLNPSRTVLEDIEDSYSSYADFLGKRNTSWVKKKDILSYFSKTNLRLSYKSFVEESKMNIDILKGLIFD